MRRLAWLHAVPEKKKKSRLKEYVDVRKKQPKMPELEYGEHIIDYLVELGWVSINGMGSAPLPFSEIDAWQRMTGVALTSWEVTIIRDLSSAYCGQAALSTDVKCPSPWVSKKDDPQDIADALDKAFDRMEQVPESRRLKR